MVKYVLRKPVLIGSLGSDIVKVRYICRKKPPRIRSIIQNLTTVSRGEWAYERFDLTLPRSPILTTFEISVF